ncbi:hypothetical protein DTO207G8_4457 [Paecilomyces variotii]|nr:hypothetical protein DTO207G8_4457 [Paecilomyces variotii]KAJ9406568.1 hypothetical protein DTO045G8_5739 [Paecilomyces variotii]
MSNLLPGDFVTSEAGYTESITVEDILSHRSGIPRHDFSYMSPRAAEPDDARSVTRNLRNLPVSTPIRTKFIYKAQDAGFIITSVNDYIRWVRAIINHKGPITEGIYNGLVKSQIFQNPEAENLNPLTSPSVYAAGWEIFYYRGHMVVSHDGADPGFGTIHFFLPGFKFGGAIFGNSSDGGIVAAILMRELIDEVLRVPRAERPDWNKIVSAENSEGKNSDEEKLRQKLSPGIQEPQPQKTPLSAYTGEYRNKGYHLFTVEVKDGKLFIDATDRSMGLTLTLEHIWDQTKYIAHMSDFLEGGDDPLIAEFKFESDKASKLGVDLESDIEELIWFTRVQ